MHKNSAPRYHHQHDPVRIESNRIRGASGGADSRCARGKKTYPSQSHGPSQRLSPKFNNSATKTRTVILRPPREMAAADHILEDEADDRPGDVVHRRRRRDRARAREDHREAAGARVAVAIVVECIVG